MINPIWNPFIETRFNILLFFFKNINPKKPIPCLGLIDVQLYSVIIKYEHNKYGHMVFYLTLWEKPYYLVKECLMTLHCPFTRTRFIIKLFTSKLFIFLLLLFWNRFLIAQLNRVLYIKLNSNVERVEKASGKLVVGLLWKKLLVNHVEKHKICVIFSH